MVTGEKMAKKKYQTKLPLKEEKSFATKAGEATGVIVAIIFFSGAFLILLVLPLITFIAAFSSGTFLGILKSLCKGFC